MEEKHRLVPRRHFRTWDIPSFSPCVGLTFSYDFFLLISEIDVMWLPAIGANFNWHLGCQAYPLWMRKESLSLGLEISPHLGIAFCPEDSPYVG